ncbi:MAG TPA: hypothetical protein VHL11_10715, partial [Phototrophicaceae bacterium]|nr:hypothetical protein [Phototrophicaceae bacterium]
ANAHGSYRGILTVTDLAPGTLEIYWPEGNVLLDPDQLSPLANIPAYKSSRATLSRWSATDPVSTIVNV